MPCAVLHEESKTGLRLETGPHQEKVWRTVVPRTFGHMLSPNTQVQFAMVSRSLG